MNSTRGPVIRTCQWDTSRKTKTDDDSGVGEKMDNKNGGKMHQGFRIANRTKRRGQRIEEDRLLMMRLENSSQSETYEATDSYTLLPQENTIMHHHLCPPQD